MTALFKSPSILRSLVKDVKNTLRVQLINGCFVAEGEASECAVWAYAMIAIEREAENRKAKEAAEKEADVFAKLVNTTFDDLMNCEWKDEAEE